jgi:hypothetical protein
MAHDNDIAALLASIAADLEALAGTTAAGALRRDPAVSAQLRRIKDALGTELSQIEADIDDIEDALGTLVPASGPRTVSFVVQDPDGTKVHGGRGTRSFCAWLNDTDSTFTLSRVRAVSDADDYVFVLFKSASTTDISVGSDVQLASVTCADDGTSGFTANVTTFDAATVESGKWIIWEHSSGSADSVSVMIEGNFA